MKPKPRVRKGADGWEVARPGYGFGKPTKNGPYPSQQAALATLRGKTASATPIIERTATPSGVEQGWYGLVTPWPMEVR